MRATGHFVQISINLRANRRGKNPIKYRQIIEKIP
jgi:hypothetical protein